MQSKIISIDVFFHAGGIFPGAPEKGPQSAKTEAAVRAYCAAHTGGGSGPAVAATFADGVPIHFADPVGFKQVSSKEALIEHFAGLPPDLKLEPKAVIVASDETQAGVYLEVVLLDGSRLPAIDRFLIQA